MPTEILVNDLLTEFSNHVTSDVVRDNITGLLQSCDHLDLEGMSKVIRAVAVANYAHQGQMRESGNMYINHPLRVARILADMKLDADIISSGVLHDVLEDSENNDYPVYEDFIEKHFGNRVKNIALGCRNSEWDVDIDVESLPGYHQGMPESENKELRKKAFATQTALKVLQNFSVRNGSYPEVVIIKLVDTVDNLREPKANERRRAVKAEEVLRVRSNLAEFIGEYPLRDEMSTLAFEAYNRDMFDKILKTLATAANQSGQGINDTEAEIYEPENYARYETIQPLFEKIYPPEETESVFLPLTGKLFGKSTQVVTGYPNLYALYRSYDNALWSTPGRSPVFTAGDLYQKVTVILPEEFTSGSVKEQVREMVNLFKENGYRVETPEKGYNDPEFIYVIDQVNRRYRVRLVTQSRYTRDNARIMDLYRSGATDQEKLAALEKLRSLQENYLLLNTGTGRSDILLAKLVDHLVGDIRVKSPVGIETPLKYGATILDYAYLTLGVDMVRLVCFRINGETYPNEFVDIRLNDNDQVELLLSASDFPTEQPHLSVTPKWLRGQSNTHIIQIVSDKVRDILKYFQENDRDTAVLWVGELVNLGHNKLQTHLPNGYMILEQKDVVEYIQKITGKNGQKYATIDDFQIGLAFSEINERDFEQISSMYNKYNLTHTKYELIIDLKDDRLQEEINRLGLAEDVDVYIVNGTVTLCYSNKLIGNTKLRQLLIAIAPPVEDEETDITDEMGLLTKRPSRRKFDKRPELSR